jgi:phosphonatase-like hydrolase
MSPTIEELELVCLDMAGTTVADEGLVLRAFEAALDALEVAPADRLAMVEVVVATMGTSKIEVFRQLFGDEGRAQRANAAFERAYHALVDEGGVHPIPGADAAMDALGFWGVKVALTTGFSAATRDALLAALGWERRADLCLSPDDAGRGRPYPDMILTAVLRLAVTDVAHVVVVGDTASDMLSGRRSGARWVVGVLSGADDRERLVGAGATHVLDSVADLPELLGAR